ncbi:MULTISPECIES: hypothetical protein [unclassified Nonomuraea]|uniref:hypothetical protein n=1 Tax=unclassified Nonomuraea TaxID=2593643 RepID=UPI0033EF428A
MGLSDAIDKLASLGAGSRMSPELLAAYKDRSQAMNALAALSDQAIGKDASRVDQRKAQADLVRAVGEKEAKKQMEHAVQRHGGKPSRFF